MPPKIETHTPDTRGDIPLMDFTMIFIGPCIVAAVIVRLPFVGDFLREYLGVYNKSGAMQILFVPLLGISAFLTRKRE